MKRILWLPTLLVMAATARAQEGEEIVGLRYRPWLPSLSGSVRSDGNVISGSNVNVVSDLDFSRTLFHDVGGWINVPLIVIDRINAEYWFGDFKSRTTLSQTITFNDNTYPATTQVDSELDIKVATLTLEKFLFKPGTNELGVALGVELGAKYFNLFGSITSTTLGFTGSQSEKAPAPIIGAHFIGEITSWFRIEAELQGIGGRYGGIQASYIEGFVEVDFSPIKQVFIGAGYKIVLLDVKDVSGNTFEANVRLDGFFLSAGVRF